MAFRTKLDFSNNRQVKQYIETLTVLSGATSFGVPFNTLPTGIDMTTSAQTDLHTSVVSTFSGNSGTTIFNWGYPVMSMGYPTLSAITPSNSGTTQYTTGYTGSSFVVIDGNNIITEYSGITFDIRCTSITGLGGGNYSGSVSTNRLLYFSANSINFTGRTIWVDVSGITRTEKLIVTNNPVIGATFTCIDSEGKGSWVPASASTSGLWIAGSGSGSVILNNGVNIASGFNSISEGSETIASGYTSHAEGYQAIAGGSGSHAEGQRTTATGQSSHAEGQGTLASGQSSHAEGNDTIASGNSSHAGGSLSSANGNYSFVHGIRSIASADSTIVLGDYITGTTSGTTYVDRLNINTLPIYADNTAAHGLDLGTVYRTSTGQLMIKY